jgi:hypothetical protein
MTKKIYSRGEDMYVNTVWQKSLDFPQTHDYEFHLLRTSRKSMKFRAQESFLYVIDKSTFITSIWDNGYLFF